MGGCGNDMLDNPKFDGQIYICQTPNWPKEKCDNAVESTHKNGECMYLHTNEDNRCDNIKNKERT
jgi:hypothetical protein